MFASDKEMGSEILSSFRIPLTEFGTKEEDVLSADMNLSLESQRRLEFLLNRIAARIVGREEEFADLAVSFSIDT